MASSYSERMPSARLVHLDELRSEGGNGARKGCVRVMGRVKSYDACKDIVVIEYRDASLHVLVSSVSTPVNFATGTLLQFIGEFVQPPPSSDMLLDARICRDVSTLNTDTFDRCLFIYRDLMACMDRDCPPPT